MSSGTVKEGTGRLIPSRLSRTTPRGSDLVTSSQQSIGKSPRDIFSEVYDKESEPLFTRNQIDDLLRLEFSSVDRRPFFETTTRKGKSNIFYFIGIVQESGYELAYGDLLALTQREGGIKDYDQYFFDSRAMADSRHKSDLFIEISRGKYDIGEGAFKCSKCGSKETVAREVQTRSADEPMTIFVTCVHCNNHWKS